MLVLEAVAGSTRPCAQVFKVIFKVNAVPIAASSAGKTLAEEKPL